MEKRLIEKEPDVPNLTKEEIDTISKACFRADDTLEPADLIFVFGSSHYVQELSETVCGLLEKKLANKVFVTGGIPKYTDSKKIDKPESLLILDHIKTDKYRDVLFYNETVSRNTLENVTEALKVLDFSKFNKIIYVFKAHASGRGYLTLKRFLPNTKLMQKTFNVTYHDGAEEITKDNWYKTDFGRRRVYGEYLRIQTIPGYSKLVH
ncbi:MAG: hypothetical protein WCS89_04695 [Candidatus Paceibacterota bacterium]